MGHNIIELPSKCFRKLTTDIKQDQAYIGWSVLSVGRVIPQFLVHSIRYRQYLCTVKIYGIFNHFFLDQNLLHTGCESDSEKLLSPFKALNIEAVYEKDMACQNADLIHVPHSPTAPRYSLT